MRIAIIGHKRIPSNEGGIEKGVEQHAVRMVKLGHQVDVYNRMGHNIFGKKYDNPKLKYYKGVRIITIPTMPNKLNVPIYSFLATIRALFGKYDVISYRGSGSCVMMNIAKLFGIRCIASLHGIDSQREKWGKFAKWYLSLGEKSAAKNADVCLVLSKNMQKYIKDTYGINSVIFTNGIDKPKLLSPNIIKQKYNLHKNEYILSLGRIVPEKALHYLIDAFKRCSTNKKFVIAGGKEKNSNYYNQLQELAKDDNRIIFTGFVVGDEICELYSNAYMFVLPSNLEGMANTLLEAMSYGLCCLVSDISENTEVVTDKAVIFNKGNTEDLHLKLQYLLDNPDIVKNYADNSSEYILDRYNWDNVVDQMIKIYSNKN